MRKDSEGWEWLQKKLWGSEVPTPAILKEDKTTRVREREQEWKEKWVVKKACTDGSSAVTDIDSDRDLNSDMASTTDPKAIHFLGTPTIPIHTVTPTTVWAPHNLNPLCSMNHHPWSQLHQNCCVLPEWAPTSHIPFEPDLFIKLSLPTLYNLLLQSDF